MAENESILAKTPPPFDRRLAYGPDANQFVDLRLPPSRGLAPLALFLHGGFWRAKYDLAHAGHICAGLAKAGFVSANLEYRRAGNPGGGWPGTFEDITNGFRYLLAHSAELHADSKRIVAIGHSAGGQLAMALAARAPELRGVISLAGLLDLKRVYERHMSNDAVIGFLGGTPAEVPEHYAEASPIEVPVRNIAQVLIHGIADETVPVDFSRLYHRRKTTLGEKVKLVELPNVGHFELIDPDDAAGKRVLQEAKRLV
jgi:acetyl esterase/lipase